MIKRTGLDAAPADERNSGKTASLMKVVVDIPSVKSGVSSPRRGFMAQTTLNLVEEREEIGQVIPIKGLGQFSQNELAPVRDFTGHHARSIAPVILILG